MKNNKKFLIGCAVLTIAGIVLSVAGTAMGGIVYNVRLGANGLHVTAPALQDDLKKKTGYYEKTETLDAFHSVEIVLEYADVRVEESETDEFQVNYSLPRAQEIEYGVSNGKLVLKSKQKGMFAFGDLSFFSIGYEPEQMRNTPQAIISVPKGEKLTDVNVETESGNVDCQDIQADNLKLMTDYGDIKLQNVQSDKTQIGLESGNLYMEQVQGTSCKLTNEYGNITIENATFKEDMDVKLESGDVSYQNARMRDLILQSSYGKVAGQQIKLRGLQAKLESSPCTWKEINLDQCEIEAEYGDVDLVLTNPLSEYEYDLKTEYGDITIGDEKMGETYRSIEHDKSGNIIIRCESGDIDVK